MKQYLFVICALLAIPSAPHAAPARKVVTDIAAQAMPAPKENRIVRYTYSPDVIFRILSVPNLTTHLELAEDEGVDETPAIGDSAQWIVTGGPRHLFIKPLRFDLETTFTVITDKRTYQFQLISGKSAGAPVYQKVSFNYPEQQALVKIRKQEAKAKVEAEENRLRDQIVAPTIDPADLDFDYEVTGTAPFKPTAVYSNGAFTYLAMPSVQDSPAIFLLDDEGNPSLINYQVKGNLVVVERMAERLLLKLGKAEVKVTKRAVNGKKRR